MLAVHEPGLEGRSIRARIERLTLGRLGWVVDVSTIPLSKGGTQSIVFQCVLYRIPSGTLLGKVRRGRKVVDDYNADRVHTECKIRRSAAPPSIDQRLRLKSLDCVESVVFIIATSRGKQLDFPDLHCFIARFGSAG